MKIYRIEYSDEFGNLVEWRGSIAEAKKRCAAIRRMYKEDAQEKAAEAAIDYNDENTPDYWRRFYHDPEPTFELVNFPTTKKAVIHWLNLWLDTNNG